MAISLGQIWCVLAMITKAGIDPSEEALCGGISFGCRPERFDLLEPIGQDASPPQSSSKFDRAVYIIIHSNLNTTTFTI
jgi:hypothetical protein